MFCRKCGKKIPDGSKFCPECGLKVPSSVNGENKIQLSDDAPSPVVPSQKTALKKQRSTKSIVIFTILATLGVLLSLYLICYSLLIVKSRELANQYDSLSSLVDNSTKPTEKKPSQKEFKEGCEAIAYTDLARNPDAAKGKHITLKGEVSQVMETSSGINAIRLLIIEPGEDNNSINRFDRNLYCDIKIAAGSSRILEGDIIRVYGVSKGLISYETIFGGKETVPRIGIKYYTILK